MRVHAVSGGQQAAVTIAVAPESARGAMGPAAVEFDGHPLSGPEAVDLER